MALTDPPKNVDFGKDNDYQDATITIGDIAGRDINKNITSQSWFAEYCEPFKYGNW